jgi:hypothetical protein
MLAPARRPIARLAGSLLVLGLAWGLALGGCGARSFPPLPQTAREQETTAAALRADARPSPLPAPPVSPFRNLPHLKAIGGTELFYAPDFAGDLFWYAGQYYWFFNFQWYVADYWGGEYRYADPVPNEFLRIPPSHPKGRVVRWHPAFVHAYGYRLQGGGRTETNIWAPSHNVEWLEEHDRKLLEWQKTRGGAKAP